MKIGELDFELVNYHGKEFKVWHLPVNGSEIKVGEILLEKEIIGWDCQPVDEEGFNLDEQIGYYADHLEEVDDVIHSYLN